MKKLIILLSMFFLTGCATQYDTIDHKDISVRVRSAFVDVDYDSRVSKEIKDLEPLTGSEIDKIED